MAWSLSHTPEAYANADANIRRLPKRTLEQCAIAWKRELRIWGEVVPNFNARKLADDTLADFVSECAMGKYGACSNGGHELYVDPEGFTTVSFDDEAEVE